MLKSLAAVAFLALTIPSQADSLSPWFGAQSQEAFQIAVPEQEQVQSQTETQPLEVAADTCAIEGCSEDEKPVNDLSITAAAP